MEKKHLMIIAFVSILLLSIAIPITFNRSSGEEIHTAVAHTKKKTNVTPINTEKNLQRFTYDSGFNFEYPDAVRGIYVTGPSAGGNRFDKLINLEVGS